MEKFIDTLSALSHDTRIRIISFLLTHGKSCVCEMEHSLKLAQARLSTNLNILKKAGFLEVSREGKWAYYTLKPKTSLHVKLLSELQSLHVKVPKKINACEIKGRKKVLILCTGNSCRSIIAEALVNAYLDGIEAKSAGVKASGKVNEFAKRVLSENGIWEDKYHSKTIQSIENEKFDLIVTVCDHAKETCPVFAYKAKHLHVSFEDPDGEEYGAFVKTFKNIKTQLLPLLRRKLCG